MTAIDEKPTAAAMRAAERLLDQAHTHWMREQSMAFESAAAIIDAETGLPELIDALGGMVEQLANQTHPDSPWGRKALKQSRDVLARVEGK
jgi:hypothetical protein